MLLLGVDGSSAAFPARLDVDFLPGVAVAVVVVVVPAVPELGLVFSLPPAPPTPTLESISVE